MFRQHQQGSRRAASQKARPMLQATTFSDLPEELLEAIFSFVYDPSRLIKVNSTLRTVGRKCWVRCSWLVRKYGKLNAFQGALRWTKLLDPDTFELLLKIVPPVPRYIIQRGVTRFQHINKLSLLIPLLQYGEMLYGDLSLAKNDGQYFKEIIPWTVHAHSNSLMTAARMEALEVLVKKYRFDVNFCKWSMVTGLPLLKTNEGFRTFLTAVSSGNKALVKVLLRYNIATHIERFPSGSPATERAYDMTMFPLFEATAQWEESFFPNETRMYMTKTVEALILATKQRQEEVMELLLEHDLERWNTAQGFEVLKATLQLAVDENYVAGVDMLTRYMGNYQQPTKSPAALRRALIAACVENDLKAVKTLLKEGARFDIAAEESGGHAGVDPLKHLIATEKEAIFQYLIRTMDFTEEKLAELLVYAIDQQSFHIARYLLTNRRQRPVITDKTIRRCIVHSGTTLIQPILKVLLAQSPDKLVPNFSAALRLAEKRYQEQRDGDTFVRELVRYRDKVMEKAAAKKAKGKAKAKARGPKRADYVSALSNMGIGASSSEAIAKPKGRSTATSRRASGAPEP
ncbi:uncharacterized protein SPPG_07641 [Spizellomyces punctatus DAOM BR117]|uniref:F-box domain-containing protein n=1 Tax=Spizellomyces punctatus (strain DAOM BR117) TaxID=645134 RepID=A0A0L0H8L1_SPIPD|nr:uncharacterized protein SPPG_07641 [Spizellomyces punctatus DAOM BR117]KNC97254.1 hypothetical protein SPPG_07641 [Spizellomyces punctatus DAOM BR117]|eukprot:XP_016605294.1 hypothetical protein SPPG_07641 [Spizellomyces punctatus DAOM BR117]